MTQGDIIDRINFFRVKRGLSARELSLRIGKHEGYVNKLECYDFTLPVPVMCEIIDALQVSMEEFFDPDYKNYHVNKEIVELLQNMSAEKRESLLKFLKTN